MQGFIGRIIVLRQAIWEFLSSGDAIIKDPALQVYIDNNEDLKNRINNIINGGTPNYVEAYSLLLEMQDIFNSSTEYVMGEPPIITSDELASLGDIIIQREESNTLANYYDAQITKINNEYNSILIDIRDKTTTLSNLDNNNTLLKQVLYTGVLTNDSLIKNVNKKYISTQYHSKLNAFNATPSEELLVDLNNILDNFMFLLHELLNTIIDVTNKKLNILENERSNCENNLKLVSNERDICHTNLDTSLAELNDSSQNYAGLMNNYNAL